MVAMVTGESARNRRRPARDRSRRAASSDASQSNPRLRIEPPGPRFGRRRRARLSMERASHGTRGGSSYARAPMWCRARDRRPSMGRLEECRAVLDPPLPPRRRARKRHRFTGRSRGTGPGAFEPVSVAERNGKIVGSVFGGWDGWRGHIYRLVVDPAERRGGLGRRLVEEAERALVARGARRLSITVAETTIARWFWWAMASSDWQHDEHAIRFTKTLR